MSKPDAELFYAQDGTPFSKYSTPGENVSLSDADQDAEPMRSDAATDDDSDDY